MPVLKTDLDLTTKDLAGLTSPDALVALLCRFGYDTGRRTVLTTTSMGLSGETAAGIRSIELLSEDEDGFLRVLFVQPKSLTAKVRNELIRVVGKATEDYLIILSSNFETIEFVLVQREKKEKAGPGGVVRYQAIPRIFSVDRRKPSPQDVRTLRQFTWTHQDALDQFDKLRVVFDNAIFTGEFFQNRGLFSDYFLRERLKEDAVWKDNPSSVFHQIKGLYQDAQSRWHDKDRAEITAQLLKPVFGQLGFLPLTPPASSVEADSQPDFLLKDPTGARNLSVAFVYPWGRWLDGPDFQDPDQPDENPGAKVVAAIEAGHADWAIVTNGRLWRLYSRKAHARSTNFYEVDLVEALNISGETDPNEAFRYWWLFFRSAAFQKGVAGEECWLDGILQGSRDYAKRLGDRLKERVFVTIFPHLAEGFLADRRSRLGLKGNPSDDELSDIYEATLTLLYRLLFLLYAESRDLLPVREGPYGEASLKKLKEEIAARAGVSLDQTDDLIKKAYSEKESALSERLSTLFKAMDKGDPVLNVPTYNGGLFNSTPDTTDDRDQRIARFLRDHRVPDRYLARAIDRLSRDQDEKTLGLVFIDFKSLEVRHLGSIYEGLLEFKLKVADDDLTTQTEKNREKYIPLSAAKAKRGRAIEVVVKKGEVYLSNDKAERKASGAYYTPDPIVEYIVGQTVGPILDEKLAALRPEFRKVRKTFDNELQKVMARPPQGVSPKDKEILRRLALEYTYPHHKELVERIFDLKVLDPAMGSGHFLVEAVDQITDKLLQFLSAFPVNPVSFALERTRAFILESLSSQGTTVLRDQLTDINLLKRHVLKRCIYGVDLNPMAVELAKVSLWLDAFTLGAPLSFLDHHLRCGNSLVGSSVSELEVVAEGRLHVEKIRAQIRVGIQNMLTVSRIADATASQAAESASLYKEIRSGLSGARLCLDLLAAEYFGVEDASSLVTEGNDIDFSSRDTALSCISDASEKKTVARAEEVARDANHKFFHWDLEFPEVYFGTRDEDLQRVRHSHRLSDPSRGFDIVVGNPPYDVMEKERGEDSDPHSETIRFVKAYGSYKPCLGGKLNLYRPFMLKGIGCLGKGGGYGQIIPMSLLADISLASTRSYILKSTHPVRFLAFPTKDDPTRRIFPEAKLSTCIAILRKQAPVKDDLTQVLTFPGNSLNEAPKSYRFAVADLELLDRGILPIPICDQEEFEVATKLHRSSIRLGDKCQITRGEINQTIYRKYITSNNSHRPLLKGVEVRLFGFNDVLSQGEREYFDERQYERDKQPKRPPASRIATQRITGVDEKRRLVCALSNNQAYFADSTNSVQPHQGVNVLLVLGVLNSRLMNWRFDLTSTNNNVGTNELEALPFPKSLDSSLVKQFESLCKAISESGGVRVKDSFRSPELSKLDDLVYALFQLAPEDVEIIKRRKAGV